VSAKASAATLSRGLGSCRTRTLFACGCTRREIADSGCQAATAGSSAAPAVTDRRRDTARALRATRRDAVIARGGALQGEVRQDLRRNVGISSSPRRQVIRLPACRRGRPAQGITDVVRGADLLDSTARQILLQRLLGLPTPRYLHLPVATNAAGEKLSKQTGAPALDRSQPAPALVAALRFLGQPAPAQLERATAGTVLEWAAANWDRASPPARDRAAPDRAESRRCRPVVQRARDVVDRFVEGRHAPTRPQLPCANAPAG
jgi:glutamyl-Q tRNA(Asp) synthetase